MQKRETIVIEPTIDLVTHPDKYKHWKLTIKGPIAWLALDVQEGQTLMPGYQLKLNSYDLGVDIELYDAVQRLRLEHPEVATVVITSAKEGVFCAGANIKMLGQASHGHKVNFCKFTNETRNSIEDASRYSGQTYVCALNGPSAGGGYELALACEYIMLIDDGSSTVSLPELPLLAVLPGTGGLTRLVDKRKIRHDHADFLCTTSEGIRGARSVDWRLVDELIPRSQFHEVVAERALQFAAQTDRPKAAHGIELSPLFRKFEPDRITYDHVTIDIDRATAAAHFMIKGPEEESPITAEAIGLAGVSFWPLALARELDDAILHLRLNEHAIGTWSFRSQGSPALVESADLALLENSDHWLVREVTLFLKRTLKRLEVSSRSLIALIEPGSCFVGSLFEIALAADRSYMLAGVFDSGDTQPAMIRLNHMNLGPLPMINGLTRLEVRFLSDTKRIEDLEDLVGCDIGAERAEELGLVTFIPDDIDWDDEVRLAFEERASFSPDALTGMEASLRFAGPETIESKIFGRLSAWQNWIFQRPNATGEQGALKLYGTGRKTQFDKTRV